MTNNMEQGMKIVLDGVKNLLELKLPEKYKLRAIRDYVDRMSKSVSGE